MVTLSPMDSDRVAEASLVGSEVLFDSGFIIFSKRCLNCGRESRDRSFISCNLIFHDGNIVTRLIIIFEWLLV